MTPTSALSWQTLDVTSSFDTWSKIDGASLSVKALKVGAKLTGLTIDAAKIVVDYTGYTPTTYGQTLTELFGASDTISLSIDTISPFTPTTYNKTFNETVGTSDSKIPQLDLFNTYTDKLAALDSILRNSNLSRSYIDELALLDTLEELRQFYREYPDIFGLVDSVTRTIDSSVSPESVTVTHRARRRIKKRLDVTVPVELNSLYNMNYDIALEASKLFATTEEHTIQCDKLFKFEQSNGITGYTTHERMLIHALLLNALSHMGDDN